MVKRPLTSGRGARAASPIGPPATANTSAKTITTIPVISTSNGGRIRTCTRAPSLRDGSTAAWITSNGFRREMPAETTATSAPRETSPTPAASPGRLASRAPTRAGASPTLATTSRFTPARDARSPGVGRDAAAMDRAPVAPNDVVRDVDVVSEPLGRLQSAVDRATEATGRGLSAPDRGSQATGPALSAPD